MVWFGHLSGFSEQPFFCASALALLTVLLPTTNRMTPPITAAAPTPTMIHGPTECPPWGGGAPPLDDSVGPALAVTAPVPVAVPLAVGVPVVVAVGAELDPGAVVVPCSCAISSRSVARRFWIFSMSGSLGARFTYSSSARTAARRSPFSSYAVAITPRMPCTLQSIVYASTK